MACANRVSFALHGSGLGVRVYCLGRQVLGPVQSSGFVHGSGCFHGYGFLQGLSSFPRLRDFLEVWSLIAVQVLRTIEAILSGETQQNQEIECTTILHVAGNSISRVRYVLVTLP